MRVRRSSATARGSPRRRAFSEPDVRLRLAEYLAERARRRRPGRAARRRTASTAKLASAGGIAAGAVVARLTRVAVELGSSWVSARRCDELGRQRTALRRAHADRARHAIAADGDAFVRPARRQIEEIARLEHVLLLGAKRRSTFSGARCVERRVVARARCANAAGRSLAAGTRRSCRRAGRRRRRRWPTRS